MTKFIIDHIAMSKYHQQQSNCFGIINPIIMILHFFPLCRMSVSILKDKCDINGYLSNSSYFECLLLYSGTISFIFFTIAISS